MVASKRKPKLKHDLLGEYTSLTHKVCKKHLDRVRRCPIFHLQKRLRFHDGSREFDGDLSLHITEPWGGTLIKGDLIVDGDLFIEDREVPALLFVFGNLRARNVLNLGARLIVKGNVETGVFINSPRHHDLYRSAGAHVTGKLSADVIAGPVDAVGGATRQIFRSGQRRSNNLTLRFFEDEAEEARTFFARELVDENELDLVAVRASIERGDALTGGTPDAPARVDALLSVLADDATEIDLSGHKLSSLPDRLFELRKLKTLILTDNELQHADERLATLPALRYLDVSGNGTWSAHDELGVIEELRQLRTLIVRGFNPSTAIRQLDKLETIDAGEVGFPLPDEFFELEKLHTLHIRSALNIRSKKNDLTEKLAKLTKLKHLSVGQGTFLEVPDALASLRRLEHLELRCSFRKRGLPPLAALQRLRTLVFDGASFDDDKPNTRWVEDILDALEGTRVTHLALPSWGRALHHRRATGKQIDREPMEQFPDRFESLTSLEHLDLSDNGLRELPESLFSLDLRSLDVRKNELGREILRRARDAFAEVLSDPA